MLNDVKAQSKQSKELILEEPSKVLRVKIRQNFSWLAFNSLRLTKLTTDELSLTQGRFVNFAQSEWWYHNTCITNRDDFEIMLNWISKQLDGKWNVNVIRVPDNDDPNEDDNNYHDNDDDHLLLRKISCLTKLCFSFETEADCMMFKLRWL